jgi:hypothetical protein
MTTPALLTPDEARVSQLEQEVTELRATVEKLCSELGLSPAGQN